MPALIITVCSNRKRYAPLPELRARELSTGSAEDVAAEWCKRIREARQHFPAEKLYCGRAFAEAAGCANACFSPLYFVSAGLGLIKGSTNIPSYSLSIIAGSEDNILKKVNSDNRAALWWTHISNYQDRDTFREVLSNHPNVIVFVALPRDYLRMIADELLSLSDACRSRLRLFSYGGAESVDVRLRHFAMPYDNRLDSLDSPIRGTRSDFAQRAMRHFVEFVLAADPKGSAQRHAARVEDALRMWTKPPLHCRRRLADEEILALIQQQWSAAQGQSTRMLRLLRDDLGVACEQRRLSHLFRRVQSQMVLAQ